MEEKEDFRVLLVDDEPDYLTQLSLLLEKENDSLDVITETSAVEALENIENGEYDAIVSDYHMPGMNGLDFLVALRDGGFDFPFIILTGKGKEEVAMEALNLGADRYVRKGKKPKALARVIAETVVSEVGKEKYKKKILEGGKRFRNFFEKLGVPVVVINKSGVIKLANKKFVTVSGYSKDELVGKKKLHDFVPDDVMEKVEGTSSSSIDEIEVRKNTFKIQFEDKSGITQDVLMNFSSIEETGDIVVSILRFMN